MMSSIFASEIFGWLVRSSPILGLLAIAGLIAGCAGLLSIFATRGRSFASRASMLHGVTVLLMAVSLVPMVPGNILPAAPRVIASTQDAAAFRAVRQATAIADRVVVSKNSSSTTRGLAALLFVVWLVGVTAFIARLVRGAILLNGISKRSRSTNRAGVMVSDEVDIPCAAGLFRPVVIVPRESESWTSDEWSSVLAHERAHLERNDVLMHWTQQLVLAIHWFNPAVHWLARRTHDACEGACDDAAVIGGADPHLYASSLISFAAGISRENPVQAAALIGRSGIELRIAALVDAQRPRRLNRGSDSFLPILAGVAGGLGAVVFVPVPAAFAIASPIIVAAQAIASPAASVDTAHVISKSHPGRKSAIEKAAANADDNVEAIAGLASLLSDANPILRQTAVDAIRSWGERGTSILRSLANGPDAERAASARLALTVIGESR